MPKKLIYISLKSLCCFLLFAAGACAQKVHTGSRANDTTPAKEFKKEQVRETTPTRQAPEAEETISESSSDIKPRLDSLVTVIAEKNKEVKYAVGYRITVFNGNDRAEYDRTKKRIKELLPDIRIYDSFSNPTYRIKVGDFTEKTDALSPYLTLKKEFPAARLIRDRVNLVK